MQECNAEPGLEKFCECVLEKLEKNFTLLDLAKLGNGEMDTSTEEEITQMYMDCFGSLTE